MFDSSTYTGSPTVIVWPYAIYVDTTKECGLAGTGQCIVALFENANPINWLKEDHRVGYS